MIINFKNKQIELRFDILFIKEIDKKLGLEMEGASFGRGAMMLAPALENAEIPQLLQTLATASKYSKQKFKNEDEILEFLDELIESETEDEDKLQELCDEILEELGKRPTIRRAIWGKQKPETKQLASE